MFGEIKEKVHWCETKVASGGKKEPNGLIKYRGLE
jgi:hypothetical protein